MQTKKHFLSFSALLLFFILAVASSQQNKIHYQAFNYYNKVELDESRNYLVKMDGTIIYSNNIIWKTTLFKDKVILDNVNISIAEVRGFKFREKYYGKLNNTFIPRIIHGKINVYVKIDEESVTETDDHGFHTSKHFSNTRHYAQRGEDGPMILLANEKVVMDFVKDCPASLHMVDKGYSQLRKGHRKDFNYMNKVFDIYNNGCNSDSDSDSL
jgi:hypothetical protein